jgi:hypothetical protein
VTRSNHFSNPRTVENHWFKSRIAQISPYLELGVYRKNEWSIRLRAPKSAQFQRKIVYEPVGLSSS